MLQKRKTRKRSASTPKKLTAAVIIPTRNRLNDLLTFIDSLAAQTIKPNELIIVDSSDEPLINNAQFNKNFSEKNFPNIKLIYKHTDIPGAARQRNVGTHLSEADIFYFFDDDSVLNKDYILFFFQKYLSKKQIKNFCLCMECYWFVCTCDYATE